ncbi:MAG: YbgC/FadM family acyl-CoA thioesterase [bacterium]
MPMFKQAVEHAAFAVQLQVNYEDTDAGGVVYYANYLGYMERARNACLRDLGFPPAQLEQRHSIVFAVTEAHLIYRAPARLDDELEATMQVARLARASMTVTQQVRRAREVLVDARIKLAALNSASGRPCRMPPPLVDALTNATAANNARNDDAA